VSDIIDSSEEGVPTISAVSLSLFRFAAPWQRGWAFVQMGAARLPLSRVPGLRFWKLCGSGVGEGFTPLPNTAVWAILGSWDDAEIAATRIADSPVFRRFRDRADESWTVYLRPISARGQWAGVHPFAVSDAPPGRDAAGPLAVLTRATIRPAALLRFWQRAPAVSDAIGADPNVMFKIGIGEVPWLHQVTFSIWPDAAGMAAFAHADGPHAKAIRAVRAGGWFKEELYARFRVLGAEGLWDGRDPLIQRECRAA